MADLFKEFLLKIASHGWYDVSIFPAYARAYLERALAFSSSSRLSVSVPEAFEMRRGPQDYGL